MRGADLHPKDHSMQLFTDASNEGWGVHLDQSCVVRWGKNATHKCSRVEGSLPGPSNLQGPVSEPNSASCNGQLNSGSLHEQGGTHSAEMCALLWKIMTCCHHYHITLKARHIPGCLNVMADLLSRSNQLQSTEWSLHLQVFKQICQKWFTPDVDLFATHLNHKLPLYVSPVPDPNAWNIDALNLNWTGLNKDPTAAFGVNDSSQTVPQLCVPQQSTASQPPHLVSRSGQLQEQGFSVGVAERIAAPQRSSTRTIYKSNWALFEKWCRENSVDFSTPSVKQVSDFFMYLYQDLNRRPSTIDGYRTAIVDTLGLTGLHISQCSDLNRLLSSFHRDCPKSSRNVSKWNLSVVFNELTKAPFEAMKDTDLKHLTSDIRPATLSSWLKQTILLCYKQADQQSLDLVQVKAHDIRAFAASKAFYGGPNHASVSLESSQHISNIYLKDLTWSDNDNHMYLGPVVAAQQVLDPCPQHTHLWEEKKGGTPAAAKSSGV